MILSIILGFFSASTILLSGLLRLLLSFVSNSTGSRVPFIYIFLGFQLGMGIDYRLEISFWPSFITGFLTAILITIFSANYSEKRGVGYSTVSTCASSFVVGSFIGLVIRLVMSIF